MYFDIKNCTIKEVLDVVSGTSKSGNDWTKATVIIEHKDGDYTDTYPMTVFGSDKVQRAEDLVGETVDVKFDIRGREYNGRWYADVNLRYINKVHEEKAAAAPAPQQAPAPEQEDDPDGDLPF